MMAVYVSVGSQGCLYKGTAGRDDQGRSKGPLLCEPSAPIRTWKAEPFLFLFPRPGE